VQDWEDFSFSIGVCCIEPRISCQLLARSLYLLV